MISNLQLFTLGNFNFRLQHLLIIGILAISFSISVMVRSQAADYGFELNEFDPFFNFRATQFIVDNGLIAYFDWHDYRSWHPEGRNVSDTSQVMLHITAATLYPIFGGGNDLYTFTILFPVVFGSLTTIVIFALVRVIGGTTAGLFAALFFSVSVPVIVRGTIGWFKSEPLGLFYGLLGIYLFLSAIKSENRKIAFVKLVGGGIFLSFGLASWGGIQFFILPLGIFFLALPFLRNDHKFILWAIPVFVVSIILTALLFERPGIDFVTGIGGVSLIGTTMFLVVCIIVQRISKKEHSLRNGLALLVGTVVGGFSIIFINSTSNFLLLPSFRYLNAINPFLTTQDPLVDSVAEHATTTLAQSFYFLSILMVFAGIGIWLIFRNKNQSSVTDIRVTNDMTGFVLIIGLIGVYISSAFVRLELFASISIILLASVGLAIISAEFLKDRKFDKKKIVHSTRSITKISFVIVIVAILIVPASTLPGAASWITGVKAPPTILNGGTNFNISTDDWPKAMEWLKNNTPKDSVVAAWWDYGYWITTLGERISLADNATLSTQQIQEIARMLLSSPDDGWKLLQELDADYVLVYAAAQRVTNQGEEPPFYLVRGGGDESKKQWFMRIGGLPEQTYLHPDGISGTNYFWENTLLGKMFPFSPIVYINFQSNLQSESWQAGFEALYKKDIKFPAEGNGPLKLVYSSPSFERDTPGPISGIFIYELNKNYVPKETTTASVSIQSKESAVISTGFGDITIELREDIAPKTVENFKNLANSGFYDNTIFHRIIPGFVIQGGDPNTISGSRDTWGQGGPDYSINAEFSDVKHEKYIVSMARGIDINSAGSQFFIVVDNSPHLDGKYTVFGKVTSGMEIIDQIAALETNSQDQPIEREKAIIEKITIIQN
jgi:dolichyl-diphosphooligosaccharide---protein glycosyltransferase